MTGIDIVILVVIAVSGLVSWFRGIIKEVVSLAAWVLAIVVTFLFSAPIASKRQERVQSSSSPPPAKTMSCLPHWICSTPLPMQWAEVEQAEVME